MKGMIPVLGWVMLGLALLASFGIDFANTAKGGSIDLRNRITGARLLAHGIDPYHYKWHEGEPEEFCDVYNDPKVTVSKTTVPPALLTFYIPLALLPYRVGQFVWLVAQWLLLLGAGWLWLRGRATPLTRFLVALFIVGFTYTAAWRLHAERGQSYTLLTFLFAGWLTSMLDPKGRRDFWGGFLAGLLVAFRPPFLILLPFLAWHRRGQWIGAATGLLLGIGVPLLLLPAAWSDYSAAVHTHSDFYLHSSYVDAGVHQLPATIEGIPTSLISGYMMVSFAQFSAHGLLFRLHREPFPPAAVFAVVALPYMIWLWLLRRRPVAGLLPGLAAWLFLSDLFLPDFRECYNDVMILNVVAAGLVLAPRFSWAAWPCALAVPVGAYIYAFSPLRVWLITLPTAMYTLVAILFILSFLAPAVNEPAEAR